MEGLGFSDVLKIESYEDKIEAHSVIGRGLVEAFRSAQDPAGTAALEAMLAEARAEGAREAYERAAQAIANLPTPKAEDVARGHEDAYLAVSALAGEVKK